MIQKNNLELWEKVEKTDPKYTKSANIKGNRITAISPQFQVKNATQQFGSYGVSWGLKKIELDYSLVDKKFFKDKTEGTYPNVKVVGKEEVCMGLVTLSAIFFFPNGEFPIINSISLFTNNEMSKLDDNFAKKIETDTLTKALSKLGFNADIFLGKFDDQRYLSDIKEEFNPNRLTEKDLEEISKKIDNCKTLNELTSIYNSDVRIKTNKILLDKLKYKKTDLTNDSIN